MAGARVHAKLHLCMQQTRARSPLVRAHTCALSQEHRAFVREAPLAQVDLRLRLCPFLLWPGFKHGVTQ